MEQIAGPSKGGQLLQGSSSEIAAQGPGQLFAVHCPRKAPGFLGRQRTQTVVTAVGSPDRHPGDIMPKVAGSSAAGLPVIVAACEQDRCSKDTYPQAEVIRRAMQRGRTGPACRADSTGLRYIAARSVASAAATFRAFARAAPG
uniref:Uncharacterized protein n=1 Tax=Bradyrhizobium amphicarpaeae TaxID=1404768 RepID=A0A2U8PWK4_9BRAD|nr:hypothetical protein CIT40_16995 [Bradyrhizobium amphicarpaeae]